MCSPPTIVKRIASNTLEHGGINVTPKQVDKTIDATALLEQSVYSILIWLDLAFSSCTNITNINLAKRKRKCQIKVGSIERFEKYSRVMESCGCVIARNAKSNGRFSCETKPNIFHIGITNKLSYCGWSTVQGFLLD